ncbi:MAG: hypothetical protein IJS15_11640 [Victivallales bacterium]|nr:hypothetical protein [Victivallales bacterium]
MKTRCFTLLFLCIIHASLSEQLIEYRLSSDFTPSKGVSSIDENTLAFTGNINCEAVHIFKVKPTVPVTISFEIRKLSENAKPVVYVGFWTYDADRIRIQPRFLRCERGGETTLLADADAGATSISLKPPPRQPSKAWKSIAIGGSKDCQLPQFDLIAVKALKASEDNSLEVTLEAPLAKPLSAGTVLHFHGEGPGMYVAYDAKTPDNEWTTVTATVVGEQEGFPVADRRWWKGTRFAKPRIVVYQSKNDKIQIRNLQVRITTP